MITECVLFFIFTLKISSNDYVLLGDILEVKLKLYKWCRTESSMELKFHSLCHTLAEEKAP